MIASASAVCACDVVCTPVARDGLSAQLWVGMLGGLGSGRGMCRCYRVLCLVSAAAVIECALQAMYAVCASDVLCTPVARDGLVADEMECWRASALGEACAAVIGGYILSLQRLVLVGH
jgi:hypothetical protein